MIASKSPVAIYTIKQVNVREMKRRIADGMDFLARMNTSMLVTGDMQEAIRANLSKDKATFPKLWQSYAYSDGFPEFLIDWIVFGSFWIVSSNHAEIVPHYDVPFLELIQVLQLLDSCLFCLVQQLIIYFDHAVYFHFLEASI